MPRRWLAAIGLLLVLLRSFDRTARGGQPAAGARPLVMHQETREEAQRRRERLEQRRSGTMVICHRGAWQFAHENTLEAYRATFELGGDGNEIDIRATSDGVLVCFHDDMLDRLTDGWGDLSEHTWEQLRQLRLNSPGRFGARARIPALAEVFELHRRHAGLLHLDIKQSGIDRAIADLLDRYDLWEHVAFCNAEQGGVIRSHPKLGLSRYKGGLYLDRGEVFPAAIAEVLRKPGDAVIVDDPRGVVLELGRRLGRPSNEPVTVGDLPGTGTEEPDRGTQKLGTPIGSLEQSALARVVEDAGDAGERAEGAEAQRHSAIRIRTRAWAARELSRSPALPPAARRALFNRVRQRSLHPHWMWHGLDGAFALRTLLRPDFFPEDDEVALARFVLWRDDPALESVVNPQFNNPRAWTDFRVKMVVFPALGGLRGSPAAEQVCRDYLSLSDQAARELGPEQFAEAADALLAIRPEVEVAEELLQHRLQLVRGQTILHCLRDESQPWGRAALMRQAPHALQYLGE